MLTYFSYLIQNVADEEGYYLWGALIPQVFLELILAAVRCWHLHESKLTSLWRMEPAGIVLNKKPSGWHHSLKWVKTKVVVGFDLDSFSKQGF